MINGRGRIGSGVTVIMLIALGAAVELYDERVSNGLDTDMIYQEDSDLDTGPNRLSERLPSMNNVMLYRLLKELQAQDAQSTQYIQHWDKTDLPVPNYVLSKRVSQTSRKDRLPVVRPQQKWKTKKGKAGGSQMVCYFKLCAFRSPA